MSRVLILTALTALLFQTVTVQAHGAVSSISIGGKTYKGPVALQEGNPASSSGIIRQVFGGGPISDVNSKDMGCGIQSGHANQVAPANPGDEISVKWRGTDGKGLWPHFFGPMFAYLASCGNTPCSEFNPANAKWFKIAQSGGRADNKWGQTAIHEGSGYTYKLPANLAPGGYILRNEAVNLALVTTAEIFPSCAQIQVGGSGTGKPSSEDLVSIPGVYKLSDFVNPQMQEITFSQASKYVMPGPKIAILGSGGGSEKTTSNNSPPKNVAAAPAKKISSSMRSMTKTKTAAASASSTAVVKNPSAKCTMSRKARRSLNGSLPPSPMAPVNYSRHNRRARAGKIGHASM